MVARLGEVLYWFGCGLAGLLILIGLSGLVFGSGPAHGTGLAFLFTASL